eukprot:725680-Pleurochrysis_carterae.AAC.4
MAALASGQNENNSRVGILIKICPLCTVLSLLSASCSLRGARAHALSLRTVSCSAGRVGAVGRAQRSRHYSTRRALISSRVSPDQPNFRFLTLLRYTSERHVNIMSIY